MTEKIDNTINEIKYILTKADVAYEYNIAEALSILYEAHKYIKAID